MGIANDYRLPVYFVRTNSMPQIQKVLKEALQMPGSKVLMKIGRSMPKLIETLHELNLEDNVYAVENCGLENEKIYNSLDEFDENMGYFTIVVVK